MILLDARIFEPAARQKSLAWYATGQRTQRIRRPVFEKENQGGAKQKQRNYLQEQCELFKSIASSMNKMPEMKTRDFKHVIHHKNEKGNHVLSLQKELDPVTVNKSVLPRKTLFKHYPYS
jgi:hypothetical protein